MDIRQLTTDFSVSPQIDPADFPAIAAAGFKTVICNRPDMENPPSHQAAQMAEAASAAGVAFEVLEITHQGLTPSHVARHNEIVAKAEGPILAYCASGNRSSIMWALGQAGKMPADEIIETGMKAGYNLSGLRGALG